MAYVFNPFTSTFDVTSSASDHWLDPVSTAASLPASGNSTGDTRAATDTGAVYVWSGSAWINSSGISGIGSAVVGGTNKSVLFVDSSGNLAQDNSDLNYDQSTNTLVVSGQVTTPSVDRASAGTLAIGTSANASTINIGNSGATVNIQGTTLYENVSQLQVKDPLVTLNKNGGSGSASNSGIELEENGSITGYAESSADRNSWILKAPNTAGIATITPGSGGITLDQSSHNPVTLAAVGSSPNANGASLSTQVLTLQPADGTNPGLLTAGSQTIGGAKTFSSTISASNLSSTNTGDISLTAVGSSPSANGATLSGQALTLQPANGSSPGLVSTGTQTFAGNKTFSGTIGASNFSGTSSGTNTGDQTITLTGDVTGSGTGSFAATIANSAVTNAKMANMSNNTVKANKSGTAAPSDLALSDITETGSSILTISNGSKTVISASNVTVQVTQSDTTHSGYLSSTDWNTFNGKANKSSGDISETSFTAADNQSSAANVTSFAFANATVRAFDALVSVVRNTTYANYILRGIQKAASWELSQDFVGDTTGLTFSITSAGQIQYVSTSTGSTATVKFRAITTSV